jgi:hypothetical protein
LIQSTVILKKTANDTYTKKELENKKDQLLPNWSYVYTEMMSNVQFAGTGQNPVR